MKRKLTQAIRDDIIDLSAHGRGQQDIATTVGVSQSTVSQVLRSYNKNEAEPTVIDARARAFLSQYRDLPAVPKRVLATKREDMGFDTPQEALSLFSDLHYGSRIDRRATGGLAEYNIDLARERLTNWRNGVLRLHQLNSLVIQIPRLNVFALGDDLEGHGAMFGSQALQMETNVLFQQMGFVEDMTRVILDLTARYPALSFYKVYGNHGRITARAKDSYGPDNLEIFAWDQIASRVQLALAKQGVEPGTRSETRNGTIQVTGGMVDFHIASAFFIRVMIRGQEFVARHGHMIGGLQQTYCMAPETPVLTRDLHWIAAGDLRVGDRIVGFDEKSGDPQHPRSYQEATITAATRRTLPLYEVTLSTGEVFRATGEHKWLVGGRYNSSLEWVPTDVMEAELNGPASHVGPRHAYYVPRFVEPWGASTDRDDGLLAGAFDADGSLTLSEDKSASLRFTQYDNELLAEVCAALTRKGYRYSLSPGEAKLNGTPFVSLKVLGGWTEVLRFLGQQRPTRLLARWNAENLSNRSVRTHSYAQVESVRRVADGEVAAISSSSQTYLASGYPVHNTGAIGNKLALDSVFGKVIPYYLKAHLHEAQSAEAQIGGEIIQNGCFVGPSMLSVERNRASASLPSQEFYLIHPRKGLTHHHRIHLASPEDIRNSEVIVDSQALLYDGGDAADVNETPIVAD